MFDGTNLTLISDVDQDTKMFGSHKRSLKPPTLLISSTKAEFLWSLAYT